MERMEQVLAGKDMAVAELMDLVGLLKRERRFGLARKGLARYASLPAVRTDPALRLKVAQQRSLCTYKDPDLPADDRLDQALVILSEVEDLARTGDQETLGQAGAIFKRKWEVTAQQRHLETSLAYYRRGYEQGVTKDHGYTGVNAAFVLDLLADIEEAATGTAPSPYGVATERRKDAARIRRDIVTALPPLADDLNGSWLKTQWWFLVTMGEAHFGLGEYDEAGTWLGQAAKLPSVPDWEWETTARQLATLLPAADRSRLARGEASSSKAESVLREFLGGNFTAVTSVVAGKMGLALSGGGFRASLFHIGVLAKLAELDLLRHVECLSCVSGGSIIGAHYYLEVRKLLQDKADAAITREDYVGIVKRVQTQFLAGVEQNIRTRIAAEFWTSAKMILWPNYSRTIRAGELYEQKLFSRVADREGIGPRWLSGLIVRPKGDPSFSPKDNNWRRAAKVPILTLNATTLNTGHNWQFTASWMGEPPASSDNAIDANYRLRRMYYEQLPEDRRNVRLGQAVAASACVPGIFEPLPLDDIYQGGLTVQLVDGGVHDNQGVASLLEQGCSVLLVSDASGQMEAQDQPSTGLLGVPLRSNSILQARVREAQFRELAARRRAGLLRGLMFIHLKKDLETSPVDWINSQDPSEPVAPKPLLQYGIQRSVQRKLAAIRTDLDSFSEAEAYALMTSGYCMAEHSLASPILGFDLPAAARLDWEFLAIEPLMKQAGEDTPLMRQLRVADKLFFKVWLLSRKLQLVAGAAALTLLWLGLTWTYQSRTRVILELTVGGVAGALLVVALGWLGWKPAVKVLRYRKTLQDVVIGLGMVTVGWLVARLHLHVFDRWFLRQGRLARLLSR